MSANNHEEIISTTTTVLFATNKVTISVDAMLTSGHIFYGVPKPGHVLLRREGGQFGAIYIDYCRYFEAC